ncbi:hypothetical protein JCM11672_20380 [Alkaliphilus crotonatoxidans]
MKIKLMLPTCIESFFCFKSLAIQNTLKCTKKKKPLKGLFHQFDPNLKIGVLQQSEKIRFFCEY